MFGELVTQYSQPLKSRLRVHIVPVPLRDLSNLLASLHQPRQGLAMSSLHRRLTISLVLILAPALVPIYTIPLMNLSNPLASLHQPFQVPFPNRLLSQPSLLLLIPALLENTRRASVLHGMGWRRCFGCSKRVQMHFLHSSQPSVD